ncbi:hypothetical protein BpHYR1_018001 [Brachionus plicatilis]|uniref:Uncharacterized protein n=1 Tax=Brachionus plicatilis TaxID=10195 RepID=A0A3M7QR86_BRAPC|nr:hypothetical protein BpHYR1_018001 [Brachionus plicatilis]
MKISCGKHPFLKKIIMICKASWYFEIYIRTYALTNHKFNDTLNKFNKVTVQIFGKAKLMIKFKELPLKNRMNPINRLNDLFFLCNFEFLKKKNYN